MNDVQEKQDIRRDILNQIANVLTTKYKLLLMLLAAIPVILVLGGVMVWQFLTVGG